MCVVRSGRTLLSLHDALPICGATPIIVRFDMSRLDGCAAGAAGAAGTEGTLAGAAVAVGWATGVRIDDGHGRAGERPDRKSTRLNSSDVRISSAVFCL